MLLHCAALAKGSTAWGIGHQRCKWSAQSLYESFHFQNAEQSKWGSSARLKWIGSNSHTHTGDSGSGCVSTSVFCLPGDDILLSKKMARQLREHGVPENNVLKFQENPFILEALCKSFVRYTKFAEWIGTYGVKDPGDVSSIIIKRPTLLRTPRKYLEKNMKRYGMMGFKQHDLGKLALSNPAIMVFDHKMLIGAIRQYKRVGISPEDFRSMVTTTPTILSLSYDLKLQTTIQWLINKLGLGAQKVRQTVLHSPWLLERSEIELDTLKTYFRGNLGLTVEHLKRMTMRNPGWIGADLKKEVVPMVQYLKTEYGINEQVIGNLFSTQPGLLVKPVENMKVNREYLMSLGLSAEDMVTVLRKAPTALYIDCDCSLKLKMDFLQNELKKSVMTIVECPGYLACRMRIILLRSEFLGPSRKDVKLRRLVEPDTEAFVIKTGKSTMQIFEQFKSEWTVPPKWKKYFPFPANDLQEGNDGANDPVNDSKPAVYREGEKGYW